MADVGAGTGKLTRLLAARGLEVTAVEPDDVMRAELARHVPPATAVLAGSGEHLPLPDASVDAVLFAQSWHWVDPLAGSAEAARVLAPGGVLGLLWNLREESSGWLADLGALLAGAGVGPPPSTVAAAGPTVGPPFTGVDAHQVPWVSRITRDGVIDLVASRSYVILLPDAERDALLAGVRELLSTHADLAGRDDLEIPYITYCYRATG